MTRITNAEQVLLLLRAHLQRAQRAGKRGAPSRQARLGPVGRLQNIASTEALSDAALARALVSSLLEEEFGSALANDPKFQRMADEVTMALSQDDASAQLMKQALAQLIGARGD